MRRDTGEKVSMPDDNLAKTIPELLETIQGDMFAKAKKQYVLILFFCEGGVVSGFGPSGRSCEQGMGVVYKGQRKG